jgi:PIN domain nuclease of toxin-antitoxin system
VLAGRIWMAPDFDDTPQGLIEAMEGRAGAVRLLLDTHAPLWALGGDPRLGRPRRLVVADPANDVWVSVVSLLEITVKLRIGKLQADIEEMTRALAPAGFLLLDLHPTHLIQMTSLPFYPDHRDPFDHALIAQAIAEEMTFVSEDRNAARYPVRRLTCSDPSPGP